MQWVRGRTSETHPIRWLVIHMEQAGKELANSGKEVELWFGSFDDVRGWIKEEKRRKIELIDKQVAIDAINLADDKGEIRSILDVIEILRKLPPVERRET